MGMMVRMGLANEMLEVCQSTALGECAMSNVISISTFRELKAAQNHQYHASLLGMDKLQLLEEMVRFQEERSRTGKLTPALIGRGIILFQLLEKNAETNELRILTRSYKRHLVCELMELKKTETPPNYVRSPSRAVLKRID